MGLMSRLFGTSSLAVEVEKHLKNEFGSRPNEAQIKACCLAISSVAMGTQDDPDPFVITAGRDRVIAPPSEIIARWRLQPIIQRRAESKQFPFDASSMRQMGSQVRKPPGIATPVVHLGSSPDRSLAQEGMRLRGRYWYDQFDSLLDEEGRIVIPSGESGFQWSWQVDGSISKGFPGEERLIVGPEQIDWARSETKRRPQRVLPYWFDNEGNLRDRKHQVVIAKDGAAYTIMSTDLLEAFPLAGRELVLSTDGSFVSQASGSNQTIISSSDIYVAAWLRK